MNNKKQELKKLQKQIKNNNDRVQSFFEIKEFCNNHLLKTDGEEIYYLKISPTNISVLSNDQIAHLIENLSNIICQIDKIEMLCTDSSQSYDENLKHLSNLSKTEENPLIKKLDDLDIKYLDNVRANTATSRAFYLVVRCKENESDMNKERFITNVIQICREHKVSVKLIEKEEIKKLISIYLEQNIYEDNLPDFDGEHYKENLYKDPKKLKNFVDLVSPSIMDFKHTNYCIIGNTYRSIIAVRGYATSTKSQALLKALGEKEGITLHVYNRIVTPDERKKIIDVAERRNNSKLRKANKLREKNEGMDNLTDLQKLLTKSHQTKELLIHCAVYIETMSTDLEKLKNLNATVSQILIDNRIISDKLMLQQKDGFACSCPFGINVFKNEFERVLPSSSVANLYPFSYSGKTDPHGNIIGKDVNGSNILTDFDKRAPDKTNGHISIFGNSGEGKSWLTKLLICIFRQQKKSLYSVDVESEFYDITKNLGGTNINMMNGDYFINVLEPKLLKSFSDEEDYSLIDDKEITAIRKNTQLSQHIAFLRDFFKVYKDEITSSQLDILEIMLAKTYEKYHITENTNLNMLSHEDFPVLSDLYEVVKNSLDNYDDEAEKRIEMLYQKEDLRALLLSLNSICVGNDSMYFNGHTNIPNADHVNFLIQEMLNTNENLKNAMYLNIFSFMQHKYFKDGNTVVICDEIHEIVKSMIVVMYIRSFVKRGRKRDSNILTASQNIEDLMLPGILEYTMPLFSIPTHRFLFFPGNVDKEKFRRVTNTTPNEFSLISSPNQGFCLYSCGDERYYMHVIAPDHKAKLFGTAGGR